MKKILLASALLASVVGSSFAATVAISIAPNGFSNIVSVVGVAKVTQFILTGGSVNSASVGIYDCSGFQTYTNPAYIATTTYATNIAYLYTNYFGVSSTNSSSIYGLTNKYTTIVDVTNTVAAVVGNYPQKLAFTSPTNTTTVVGGVNYYFSQGVWATNTGTSIAILTVTFQQ